MTQQRRMADTLAEILAALGDVQGRRILDVGCGHGRLAKALAERGAAVTAIDPDGDAIAATHAAAPAVRARQASADDLPFEDAGFDGVIFLNSLHHVAPDLIARALAEAGRVARDDAPVVIVEPLAEGSFFEAMRPLEDETGVRESAQAAIAAACDGGPLLLVEMSEFERSEPFRDVDQFLERLVGADPTRRGALAGARDAVAERFGALGEAAPGGVTLRQPLRLHRLVRVGTKAPASG